MEAHWIHRLTSNQHWLWLLWVPEQVIANGTRSHWHSANFIQTKYIWKGQTQWLQQSAETPLIALPPQPEGMQTHSFWHQGDTRGHVLMTLCCHAKKMARLMGLGAGLFLGRIPGSLEPWARSLLQAMGGSMNFTSAKCVNSKNGWKQNQELPHPAALPSPSLMDNTLHLPSPPSLSSKRSVTQPLLVQLDHVRNWKNIFELYPVCSEKLELFTGVSWGTPYYRMDSWFHINPKRKIN